MEPRHASPLSSDQDLAEIGQDVVDSLDPHGQARQIRSDAAAALDGGECVALAGGCLPATCRAFSLWISMRSENRGAAAGV